MGSGPLNKPPGGLGSDVQIILTFPGTLKKGGTTIILEFSTGVQRNPGHDKAQSYFVYISPSTLWILAKFDIHGKLHLRRIQWHWLQARSLDENSLRMLGITGVSIIQA